MSTDFENELRDLFREKAAEAPLATPAMPASAPPQVLRRGRIHQFGTVLGSMVVVVALIVGSVAGLTRILGEGEDRVGGDDYEVFQRTATIEAFTLGSPSDWYLVNQWPTSMLIAVEGSGGSSSACVAVPGGSVQKCEDTPSAGTSSPIPVPYGLPMLQLSNVDLGLGTNACEGGLGADAAVLYVAFDYGRSIADGGAGLDPFPSGEPGLGPVVGGPCGPGRYAHFTVNGEPFFSWVGVGAGVTAQDREIVENSYEMMSAIPDWEPAPPNETTPAYVIAGGQHGPGDDWRIELRPDGDAIQLSLDGSPAPDVLLTDGTVEHLTWTGTDPIFGAITRAATGVEFRPGAENVEYNLGQSPVAGTIVPLPPTLSSFGFDVFFIDPAQGYGELGGRVIALGVDETTPTPSPAPSGEPQAGVVSLSGGDASYTWTVRFTGAFVVGTACVVVRQDRAAADRLCPGPDGIDGSFAGPLPSMHGWLTSGSYLLAGAVPPEVDDIRFSDPDGNARIMDRQCTTGPIGWTDPDRDVCVLTLPAEGSGTLRFLDAQGDVVHEEEMAWAADSAAPEIPTPADPVHGGTYWAVYPWVGAPGSPEADDVSAQLLEEFGIEAYPGDLSCDDGAAEALGTDAPQGIGVYFEIEDEANAFADQAGLLGHEGSPVIARVTTYCLD